uniref:Uncharacterized protein n=1 Tax=Arundo donax TaxID=35708 RepID=A0A0A9GN22_ARUDO
MCGVLLAYLQKEKRTYLRTPLLLTLRKN